MLTTVALMSLLVILKPARPPVIISNIEDAEIYSDLITPLVNAHCARCHNSSRQKGGLDLTTIAGWLKGGKSGAAVVPGSAAQSELVRRLTLSSLDRARMPPRMTAGIPADQALLIAWWIDAGLPTGTAIAEMPKGDDVVAALQNLARETPAGANPVPRRSGPEVRAAAEATERPHGTMSAAIDVKRHARSILAKHCFACHGPDAAAREADLRLDTDEGLSTRLQGDEQRFPVTPYRPEESELYHRIVASNPEESMPPPESGLRLSDQEIGILRQWITEGAQFAPHWAFVASVKPSVPAVQNDAWPNNPIDNFILARLEQAGLEPASEAGKARLLRRVTFDLTGLPPTIDELDAFLGDSSPDGYEKVIDRLLGSRAFGERMAVEWLDLARYADSHGYDHDLPNHMWPWRDWVIAAFNDNMPFDQFGTWQLAGDLLPDPSREQVLATGFNRLHQQTSAIGVDAEQFRLEYAADRVLTMSTAFLGISMQCARCHDHRYDPVSQRDYYRLLAFFDKTNDSGQVPDEGTAGPALLLPDPTTGAEIRRIDDQIRQLETALEAAKEHRAVDSYCDSQDQADSLQAPGPADDGMIMYFTMDALNGEPYLESETGEFVVGTIHGSPRQVTGVSDQALAFSRGDYLNLGQQASFEASDPFSISLWVNPAADTNDVPLISNRLAMERGGQGYEIALFQDRVSVQLVHAWPHNSIHLLSETPVPVDKWTHLVVAYDGSGNASGIQIFIGGLPVDVIVEQDFLYKGIHSVPRDTLVAGRRGSIPTDFEQLRIDELRIFDRELSAAEITHGAGDGAWPAHDVHPPERGELHAGRCFPDVSPPVRELLAELRWMRSRKYAVMESVPEVMVMRDKSRAAPTHVLERGQYGSKLAEVHPGAPESILPFELVFPANRLGLAQWLFDARHPLTARVLVNRYWQTLFGTGLVATADDFGHRGAMPSHPELLDWLAVDFRESGWDMKALLKKIVMTRTYRQSSVMRSDLELIDPGNLLLARGPVHRLPAEMIRDQALAISGLLVNRLGGPPVFPYQPEGLWEEQSSGRGLSSYPQSTGDSLYRRSIYTFWKRSVPPPGMTILDASTRTHTLAKRQPTNTPMQALYLLNDPVFLEAARRVAEEMMRSGGATWEDQLNFVFRKVLARNPATREVRLLDDLYQRQRSLFAKDPVQAKRFLAAGTSPVDATLDPVDLAARALVVQTILNFYEATMKL